MTQATVIADGVYFGEGPRWHDGRLWFSDFFAHAIKSVDETGDVRIEVQLADDVRSSGLGWLPDGRLVYVSMIDRRVVRVDPDGHVTHGDLSSIATFHCNDMVVDSVGRAYVGNFGFDLDRVNTHGPDGIDPTHFTATLARIDPDGTVHAEADDMHFANGPVITPDGRTLVVAESGASRLTAFDIGDDGSLSNRRVWADLGGRVPDGICLDANGDIWVANPMTPECFLVAEGGEVLDVIDTGDRCFACMLGGDDRRTLFVLTAPESHADLASGAAGRRRPTAPTPGACWTRC